MKLLKKLVDHEYYLIIGGTILFLLVLLIFFPNDTSYWTQYWWMFPIAFSISLIVNTVGISGAALFVPFFVLIFPLLSVPLLPVQSIKLSLITESFGLSSSMLAFIRYKLVDKKIGLYSFLSAVPFVILGASVAFYIPKFLMYFMVASSLMVATFLLLERHRKGVIVKSKIKERGEKKVLLKSRDGTRYVYTHSGYLKRFFGYGVGGIFQGMSGFGIGELGIISMNITNIPLKIAIGTSHMIVALTAVVASAVFIGGSKIVGLSTPWNIIIITVPAVVAGGQLAPYTAARLKSKTLEHIIAILFVIIALALIYISINA